MLVPSLLPGIGRLLKSVCLQYRSNGPWLEALAGVLIKTTQGQTKEPRNHVETAFVEAVKQEAEISLPLLSTQVECRLPKRLRSHSLQFVPANSHWHRCKGALPNQQKHALESKVNPPSAIATKNQ